MRRAKSVPIRLDEQEGLDDASKPRAEAGSSRESFNHISQEEWDSDAAFRKEMFQKAKKMGGVVGDVYIRLIKKEVERKKRMGILFPSTHHKPAAQLTMAEMLDNGGAQEQAPEYSQPFSPKGSRAGLPPITEGDPSAALRESFRKRGAAFSPAAVAGATSADNSPSPMRRVASAPQAMDSAGSGSASSRGVSFSPGGADSKGGSKSFARGGIPIVAPTPSAQNALIC